MTYSVIKVGAVGFDSCHAHGLGVLLANAGECPVQLRDEGTRYTLLMPVEDFPSAGENLLRNILALPTIAEIQSLEKNLTATVPVANLDGLLATLFTTRGPRCVSVHDLLSRRELGRPIDDVLAKAERAIARLCDYARREGRRDASGWLSDLLSDYSDSPNMPVPVEASAGDIIVPMTIDPAFSYSARRQLSDGLITQGRNVTMQGTRYAALLAHIGAARFLRAQRVAGRLVDFYLPVPSSLTIYPDTSLPCLYGTPLSFGRAVALQWLSYWKHIRSSATHWRSLAYQVLQTQGAQQSVSREHGAIDYAWLAILEEQAGSPLSDYWCWLLGGHPRGLRLDLDNLVDFLLRRSVNAWQRHLAGVATYLCSCPKITIRPYRLEEVKEVLIAMDAPTSPLRAVIERRAGTLRYGQALRSLGEWNESIFLDIIDALDSVHTVEQLLRVLSRATQECATGKAKCSRLIVPNEDDLKFLLDDAEQMGARMIATLLFHLSVLWYPRGTTSRQEPPSDATADKSEDEPNGKA